MTFLAFLCSLITIIRISLYFLGEFFPSHRQTFIDPERTFMRTFTLTVHDLRPRPKIVECSMRDLYKVQPA